MTFFRKPALPFFVAALLLTVSTAWAEGDEVKILPDIDYGGELLVRSTLTGDWGGARTDLSRKGIQFDNSLTHVAGSVVDGGVTGPVLSRFFSGRDDEETHLSWDNVLQFDTGKLGLWPGGVLKIRGEGRTGKGVNASAGAISPVDSDMLFPLSNFGDTIYDLTEATFLQFLSEYMGVVVGLLNTLDGDALDLAGSTRGTAQFSNLSFQLNPVELAAVPYKTLGGGVILLPTGDPHALTISALVFNTEDSSGGDPFSRDAGTSYSTEVNHRFRLFDRPGKQVAGFVYADADFGNLEDPRIILPGPAGSAKNSTWAAYYGFEHYFKVDAETEHGTKGIGVFGRIGFSDGNPNPVEGGFSIGIGGNSPLRSQDTFGLGAYYVDVSDAAILDALNVEDEQGLELWYNIELAPWLHVTPDLQIIDQGLPGTDTAYVVGIRTHLDL